MEELKNINLNFEESISSKGYNTSDKTLTLTKHPLCVDSNLVSADGLPRVNTSEIVMRTLDVIELYTWDKILYIPKDGPIGIEALYRIIDSPTLTLDVKTATAYEPVNFYFDLKTNVGVIIRLTEMEHTVNGYYNIWSLIVSREPNKQERVESFVKTHCSFNPKAIPEGMTRDQANERWAIENGLALPKN